MSHDQAEAQRLFEERRAFVMGEGQLWYILRVFSGQPLKVAADIRQRGIEAYCPVEITRRRHPKGKEVFVHHRPLFGGYIFSPAHFPAELLNAARTKVGWLTTEDVEGRLRICHLSERQMNDVRLMEKFQAKQIEGFLKAIDQIVAAVRKHLNKFMPLSDFQTLAKSQGHGIHVVGRAA